MQFDFFALSTTLIDTAKLLLQPDTVSTYVYLCPFMSTYCFLNAVTQYVVLGGLRLRFVGQKTKVVRRKEGGSRLNCRNYGVP